MLHGEIQAMFKSLKNFCPQKFTVVKSEVLTLFQKFSSSTEIFLQSQSHMLPTSSLMFAVKFV